MAHRHSSFLLRCWDLGGDSERIEIEHIQSGTKMLARSIGAAVEWICEQGNAPVRPPAPDQSGSELGDEDSEGGGT